MIIVWQKLLVKYQYDDVAVVDFMLKGVPIVGCHDTPQCYPEKIEPASLEPASLTKEDLGASAVWWRRAALGKVELPVDGEHVAHLEQTAVEELAAGFMEGPFETEDQVATYFGHSRWAVVRRFVFGSGSRDGAAPYR